MLTMIVSWVFMFRDSFYRRGVGLKQRLSRPMKVSYRPHPALYPGQAAQAPDRGKDSTQYVQSIPPCIAMSAVRVTCVRSFHPPAGERQVTSL